MYIVYSICEKTFELNLYAYTNEEHEASELLDKTALDFLIYEEGKRRAKILEGPLSTCHTSIDQGYFLHRSSETHIDVYYKSQKVNTGWITTSLEHDVKKIKFFSLVSFSMNPENFTISTHQDYTPQIKKNPAMDSIIEELRRKFEKMDIDQQADEQADEQADQQKNEVILVKSSDDNNEDDNDSDDCFHYY